MSKLYVWVNSRLSPIQKGIQATHVLTSIVADYMLDPDADQSSREELRKWVLDPNSRVTVLLEGGTHNDLEILSDMFSNMPDDDNYPYGAFQESDLNDAFTAVGIVLDEEWDQENRINLANNGDLNAWESALLNKLMTSTEAR